MNNKSIERLVLLGFGFSLTLILALSGVAWYGSRSATDAARLVAHTQEVLGVIGGIHSDVYLAESSQRAYFLTEASHYLNERSAAWVDLQVGVEELARLTRDNLYQQQRLGPLRTALQQRKQVLDEHLRLFQSDRKNLSAIRADFETGHNRTILIRKLLDEMRVEETRLLSDREKESASQRKLGTASFVILVPLLCLLLAFLFARIRRDMTLRAAAEAEQSKLISILNATPDLVAMWDTEKRLTYLNRAGRRALGIPSEAPLDGRRVSELYGELDKENEDERLLTAEKQGIWRGEARFKISGGHEAPTLQVIMTHVQTDGRIQYSTIAHDISERQRNEEALRKAAVYEESHSRILSVFASTLERQSILDETLRLLAEHHPFPASAIYLHDDWHGCYRLEAKYGATGNIKDSFRNNDGLLGQAAAAQRLTVLRDTSEETGLKLDTGIAAFYPAAVLMVPILYQNRTLGMLTLAASRPVEERDQSFVERLARQLGVALHNLKLYGDTKLLAEQLRAGSEEIARKNMELEQASRTKSEFLANMSHELRTPLNAVVGFAEVLKDGLAGDLTDKQREYIADIFSSGQHLLSLINDILDLSKVEAGKMTLDVGPVKVQPLLSNALTIVKEKAAAHRIRLTLDVPPDLDTLNADERRLKQVIYNLLSNALKFSPNDAEVALKVRVVPRAKVGKIDSPMPKRTLPLPLGEGEQFLEITVTDKGIGISEAGIAALFQPFTQADAGLARKFEGTGLGLVMVSRLVELHGGTVGVASAEGEGTQFTVWLPMHAPVSAAEQSLSPIRKHLPSSTVTHALSGAEGERYALVVEDDAKAAEVIRLQLEAEGLRVQIASTAEEGLQLAKQKRFALITLDILLPGMDGWEFLARIKEDPDTASLPVVIISIVADTNRGLSLGASAILQKPFGQDTLLSTLADLGFVGFDENPLDVLVVDDDPKSVEIIANHLQRAGCRVIRAYGGKDGVDTALSVVPDLIVLDLMMPEVSGFDVVEILKGDKRTAMIPILVVTAKQIEARDRQMLQGHVMKIIEKVDFNHGRFISEVRRVMNTPNKGI